MMGDWTFFSNYGHVLVCLARNREVRLRDVATEVGITERAVQKIVRDLQDAGYLTITKQGRCNRYRINRRKTLRHSLVSHCTVGKLLTLTSRPARAASRSREEPVTADSTAPEMQEPAEARPTGSAKPQAAGNKKSRPRKRQDAEESSSPLDTRQQGSLF